MDSYDLVVLKTIAIAEYGVRNSICTNYMFLTITVPCFSFVPNIPMLTLSILQVRVVPAKYIMKCDDDTFVRIDLVLDQVKKVPSGASMYVGNINYYHKPLRSGKWAVTYEV
jgi:hypothetical protein